MQFNFSPPLEEFRLEVRQFIAENLPSDWAAHAAAGEGYDERTMTVTRQFQKKMAERRWLTMHWPKEYGGLAADHWQKLVLDEEMAYHRAPHFNMGVGWVGPTIMIYGTEEQKKEHIGRIARAESWWCTLYSEPSNGSDLAGLQTRAVRDGDDYVINGQKIWTSGAHVADWGWLAARTDAEAPKHKGITLFVVDMKTPGITVRPIIDCANGHVLNETFFEDVRIPKRSVVGEVNRGWYHVAVALDFERGSLAVTTGIKRSLDDITGYLQANPALVRQNPQIRMELTDRWIELAVARYMGYRIISIIASGGVPNTEASVAKNFGAELGQRVARTAIRVVGLHGQLRPDDARAPLGGALESGYLRTIPSTIAGGSSEVNRNVIATRGLGMPRG